MASSNMATSASATQMRWLKLYRKIHNMFMKDEFVHIADYQAMLADLNAKIAMLNAKLDANLAATKVQFDTHTHPSPPAPINPVVTSVPLVPMIHDATPIPPVPFVNTAMLAYDASLQATGPGFAPMGDGTSQESVEASFQALQDVGL